MKQQGAITLLVTTMVAVASLLFSLASYKNVFYQIKRTQNEVLTSQAHWKAEGGLECGYSTMKNSPNPENADLPNFFPVGCNSELGIDLKAKKILPTSNILLSSKFTGRANKKIKRVVSIDSKKNFSGAIQVGSNLYTFNSLRIYDPEPGIEKDNGWTCVAIKYKNKFINKGSLVNMGFSNVHDYPFDPRGKNCIPKGANGEKGHMTETSNEKNYENDIVYDNNMSPFEDFFNIKDKDHNKVRDEKFSIVLTDVSKGNKGSNTYSGFSGCGPAIIEAMKNKNDSIWIEGNCDINAKQYREIVKLSSMLDGAMILVHDGLFSIYPSGSSQKYQGLIIHYNLDYKFKFSDWMESQAYNDLNHNPSVFGESAAFASYVQSGALNMSGALILDAKEMGGAGEYIHQNASLYTSYGMSFNGNHVSKFGGGGTEIKWLEGSWNDF